jgi:phosphoribosyl-dephospho-CoA transferase
MSSSNVCWPVAESTTLDRHALARHTLVWVRPESHATVTAQAGDDAMQMQVAAWLAADRPLVVARQPCGENSSATIAAGTIATGLALPPASGKCRIALGVAAQDIARYTPPLRLDHAIAHAPAGWQPALVELDGAASDIGIELHVFGSLSWQALSGLQYLTPRSDIDLLWQPHSHVQLRQGVELLARWEQEHGLRADGEVLFGGNSAVSWREWATLRSGGDGRVLVKRQSSAELVAARELLEMLA